jgi:hypothetical protein
VPVPASGTTTTPPLLEELPTPAPLLLDELPTPAPLLELPAPAPLLEELPVPVPAPLLLLEAPLLPVPVVGPPLLPDDPLVPPDDVPGSEVPGAPASAPITTPPELDEETLSVAGLPARPGSDPTMASQPLIDQARYPAARAKLNFVIVFIAGSFVVDGTGRGGPGT